MTIEVPVSFQPVGRYGRKALRSGEEKPAMPPGRVPRVARLMALALRFDALLRSCQVRSCGDLALLGQVTRARVSQILNLMYLAPDIQEALLFLPRTQRGRDAIILADMMPIAATFDWRKRRRLWWQLLPA
jgi:hypothetical protein